MLIPRGTDVFSFECTTVKHRGPILVINRIKFDRHLVITRIYLGNYKRVFWGSLVKCPFVSDFRRNG